MVVAATGSWQGAHRNHNPLHRSPPCCLPIQGNQACYNRSSCHQKTAKNEVLFSEAAPHHLPTAPSILRTILNRPSRSKGPMNSLPWGDTGKITKLYILISWVKSVKLYWDPEDWKIGIIYKKEMQRLLALSKKICAHSWKPCFQCDWVAYQPRPRLDLHVCALNGRRCGLAQPQFHFQPADSTRKNISDKNCKLMCTSIIQG